MKVTKKKSRAKSRVERRRPLRTASRTEQRERPRVRRERRADRTSLSREVRRAPEPPRGNVDAIAKGLRSAFGDRSERDDDRNVGVATYNIGAGNDKVATREKFDQTSDLLAEQIVRGDTDVAMLQEVGNDGRNTGDRDNNQEILEKVFLEELGGGWQDSDLDRQSLGQDGKPIVDGDGKPVYDPERYADTRVTATNDEGQSRDMTVTRERYDDNGALVEWDEGFRNGRVVHYQADMGEDKEYSMVFGSSTEGGTYGNSVLLRPGYEVKDVQRQVLGQDPDENDGKPPEDRTALGVTFETPGGEELTAISAHLTNGGARDRGEARNGQYRELDRFAEGFGSENPVLVGGDFNSQAGGQYDTRFYDFLPWIEDRPTHPSAGELGWHDPDKDVESIDRLYTLGDLSVSEREELSGQGGSDHPMITWDVAI